MKENIKEKQIQEQMTHKRASGSETKTKEKANGKSKDLEKSIGSKKSQKQGKKRAIALR